MLAKQTRRIVGSAALATALLAPSPTLSNIWHSGIQDIRVGIYLANPGDPPQGQMVLNIDFNADSVLDYTFEFEPATHLWLHSHGMNEVVVGPPYAEMHPLEAGHLIDAELSPAQTWSQNTHVMLEWRKPVAGDLVTGGPWTGETGYIGTAFDIGGQTHYGWIRVTGHEEPAYATVHDWAYNTVPGESITTGVIPEPATVGLFALGLAVMLARHLRRVSRT